jgi:putative flippase GtrA
MKAVTNPCEMKRGLIQNWRQMLRYLLTSVFVYAFILLALYGLVDRVGVSATPAYIAVFLFAYIVEYLATVLLVFGKRHSLGNALRFVVYVLLFLGTSTFLFKGILSLGLHYLAAALSTSALLMPIRFISSKLWVYK